MAKPQDDLEAVRVLVDALEGFSGDERERILRWTREKLGMSTDIHDEVSAAGSAPKSSDQSSAPTEGPERGRAQRRDLKSFVTQKDPKNDWHLSAVVAYYYQFVAPENERKDYITSQDLIDACRLADRTRPARPAQTLVNAYTGGLLDRGEKGQYRLNSVGENLVAMVLPGGEEQRVGRRTTGRRSAAGRSRNTTGRKAAKGGKRNAPRRSPSARSRTRKR